MRRISESGKKTLLKAARNKGWVDASGDLTKAGKDFWSYAASEIAKLEGSFIKDGQDFASGCTPKALDKLLRKGDIQDKPFRYFCEAVDVNSESVCQQEIQKVSTNHKSTELVETDAPFYSTQPDKIWVGRENIRDSLLKNKLNKNTRILVIVGISGIGKTSLAGKLIESLDRAGYKLLEPEVDCSATNTSPSFSTVLEQWLINWGEKISNEEKKLENADRLIERILTKLRKQKYILFLDAIEHILKGDEQTEENQFVDPIWQKFLEKVLTTPEFLSRIIITSQTEPSGYQEIAPKYWYISPLSGLDDDACLEMFHRVGIDVDDDEDNCLYVERIIKIYGGHPLALWIIAKEIIIDFNGDAEQYWEEYKTTLEQFETIISSTPVVSEKDRYDLHTNELLEQRVKNLIKQTFNRLQKDTLKSYQFLLIGSAFRQFVKPIAWFAGSAVLGYTQQQSKAALRMLEARCLVEKKLHRKKVYKIGLHNLIRSIALESAQTASANIPKAVYDRMREVVSKKKNESIPK